MTVADVVLLASDQPTADEVKPGWLALVIVLAMGVALALLMWSMVRQFRKVTFTEDTNSDAEPSADSDADADSATEQHDEHETNGSPH